MRLLPQSTSLLRFPTRRTQAGSVLRESLYGIELLLEGRAGIFVGADIMIIGQALVAALANSGRLPAIYTNVAVLPILLAGVPMLSSAVALERNSGSLDLALAVPSTERYFLRRTLPVCVFLILQSWFCLLMAIYIAKEGMFFSYLQNNAWKLLPPLLHTTILAFLVAAITLFWASRIATTGGVMVASLITVILLSNWIFIYPILDGLGMPKTWIFRVIPPVLLSLVWNLAVLALAAGIFYLYARERLRRPEKMLA